MHMRRLIWIPIIHTQTDFGSLGAPYEELYKKKIGQDRWNQHARMVDQLWRTIRRDVENLHLDCTTVRLYQDGLPDCDTAGQIVEELARRGSANHQLLLELVKKGAKLTGTESPELLREEYEVFRKALEFARADELEKLESLDGERSKELLRKRDHFIARRIAETLGAGETGLIFLGMLHSIKDHLPPDIELRVVGQKRHM